jgi:hypothetical protein
MLADITAKPEEFRKALSRGVLAGKCVELRAVLMVEAPADAAYMTVSQTPLADAVNVLFPAFCLTFYCVTWISGIVALFCRTTSEAFHVEDETVASIPSSTR